MLRFLTLFLTHLLEAPALRTHSCFDSGLVTPLVSYRGHALVSCVPCSLESASFPALRWPALVSPSTLRVQAEALELRRGNKDGTRKGLSGLSLLSMQGSCFLSSACSRIFGESGSPAKIMEMEQRHQQQQEQQPKSLGSCRFLPSYQPLTDVTAAGSQCLVAYRSVEPDQDDSKVESEEGASRLGDATLPKNKTSTHALRNTRTICT